MMEGIDMEDIRSYGFIRSFIHRTLGDIGDRETETQVILLEHDIPPNTFSREVMECLPPDDWCISEENSQGREV